MNEKYFRITAYSKDNDFSCIIDSNGMFEKLWQFSAYLVSKELNIIQSINRNKPGAKTLGLFCAYSIHKYLIHH